MTTQKKAISFGKIKHLLLLCFSWMCGSGGWYWKGRARGCGSICIDYPFLDPKKINPTEGNTAINPFASAEVVFLPWRRVLVPDTIIFHFHFFFKFFILLLFPQPPCLPINQLTYNEGETEPDWGSMQWTFHTSFRSVLTLGLLPGG